MTSMRKAKQVEAQSIKPLTPKSKIEPPIAHPSQSEGQKEMHATPDSIGTPVSSKFTDNASDSSPATSTISAASVTTPSNVQCRGRPHKIVSRPDYSDFPVGGTYEEQDRWFKAKRTNMWWYNILMSDQDAAYRARENEQTTNYYHKKRAKAEESSCSQGAGATASKSGENDNLDGIDVLEVDDSSHTTAQEKAVIYILYHT